ncbi:hypothetical protein V5799_007478 [Amblyomma americanum]|uniref:Uncharacterized protein n=1 Tax=Amblyomma americanum TaxID=6943 RepID=A0AAQ4FFS0_AMBAM
MAAIKKAFEESGNDEQNAPSKYSASPSVNLLCRFSPRYRAGIYPYGVCSHFIYASVPSPPGPNAPTDKEVLYNYDPGALAHPT